MRPTVAMVADGITRMDWRVTAGADAEPLGQDDSVPVVGNVVHGHFTIQHSSKRNSAPGTVARIPMGAIVLVAKPTTWAHRTRNGAGLANVNRLKGWNPGPDQEDRGHGQVPPSGEARTGTPGPMARSDPSPRRMTRPVTGCLGGLVMRPKKQRMRFVDYFVW
jgi:hypothetical protein